MASTLSTFRTQIRRYLKETNANTSFWDANFIDQLFNAQYRKRCTQLIMAFEGWFADPKGLNKAIEDMAVFYAYRAGRMSLKAANSMSSRPLAANPH